MGVLDVHDISFVWFWKASSEKHYARPFPAKEWLNAAVGNWYAELCRRLEPAFHFLTYWKKHRKWVQQIMHNPKWVCSIYTCKNELGYKDCTENELKRSQSHKKTFRKPGKLFAQDQLGILEESTKKGCTVHTVLGVWLEKEKKRLQGELQMRGHGNLVSVANYQPTFSLSRHVISQKDWKQLCDCKSSNQLQMLLHFSQ